MDSKCDKCVFEPPCTLCVYVNRNKVTAKPVKLKMFPVERREIQAMRNKDLVRGMI